MGPKAAWTWSPVIVTRETSRCFAQVVVQNITNIGAEISKCISPSYSPKHRGRYCLGERRRYKICHTAACLHELPTFRDLQCSHFNTMPYKGKLYKWEAVISRGELHVSSFPHACGAVNASKLLLVWAAEMWTITARWHLARAAQGIFTLLLTVQWHGRKIVPTWNSSKKSRWINSTTGKGKIMDLWFWGELSNPNLNPFNQIQAVTDRLKVKLLPKCNLSFFFLWMFMSQTFLWKHNYNDRGTFKIDHVFVLGSNSFSMGVHGALLC